ncbi:unnamed protein product [Porites evermanni]|uniref:Apple domain-containing protein n=1 Tax=Porites evermanni TaxID=104178 RepID=A0ABN8LUG2_9CNID|nr:unnamed protein product [Porites evermanni]
MQHLVAFIFITIIIRCSMMTTHGLEQCQVQSVSIYGYYLTGHVIYTKTCASLSECVILCSYEFRCKSFNFRLMDKLCELNDADRFTHPVEYVPMEGFLYKDTTERHRKNPGFGSCAEILREFPQAQSTYYWLKIGDRDAQVYCDMGKYGGGWTLVASISSTNHQHLQRIENYCFNSVLCVPFNETIIKARKLSDQEIHKLAQIEGSFRVDVLGPGNKVNHTLFYQIPSGREKFNSSCSGKLCPRMIISCIYPYQWETNNCTSINQGYQIADGECYRVFDGHDNRECNGTSFVYFFC